MTIAVAAGPQALAEAGVLVAAALGVQVVVVVEELSSVHVRWSRNAVSGNGAVTDRQVTVVAMAPGRRPGVVTARGAVDFARVESLVHAARGALGPRGSAAPDPPELPGPRPDDGWCRPAGAVDPAGLASFTRRLGAGFAGAAADGLLMYGFAEQRSRTVHLASSTGARLRHEQTGALLDHTVRTGADEVSTWTGGHGADLAALDLAGAYATARDRLAARRVAAPADPIEVLLAPACVADLMLHLYEAASARDAREGRTAFSAGDGGTRVGERLSPLPLSLYSDPAEPGLPCAPFAIATGSGPNSVHDNGLPLTRTGWITDGVLSALVQSREAARAGGGPATPQIDNLTLAGGNGRTLDQMIGSTRRGLLITALWYVRPVDPAALRVTGLTRDGVYLIEDGRIRGVTGDFRLHTGPLEVLANVLEAGATGPALPREYAHHEVRTAMPPLRITGLDMTVTPDAS